MRQIVSGWGEVLVSTGAGAVHSHRADLPLIAAILVVLGAYAFVVAVIVLGKSDDISVPSQRLNLRPPKRSDENSSILESGGLVGATSNRVATLPTSLHPTLAGGTTRSAASARHYDSV